MIAKIILGTEIKGAIDYINREESKAELIGDSMGDLPKDLQLSILGDCTSQNNRLKKNVFHGSISLEPGQKLSKEEWRKIGDGYMNHMGFSNAPYVMVRHGNTDKDHIHLVASRIDYEGKTISDSQSYRRAMSYMREMEKKYNLQFVDTPALYTGEKNKSSKELHAAKRGEPLVKTKIKEMVKAAMSSATGESRKALQSSFNKTLKAAGVNYRLNKRKDGTVYGMSYEMEGVAIKASSLGKKFQFKQLNEQLSERFKSQEGIEKVAVAKPINKRSDKLVRQKIRNSIDYAIKETKGKDVASFNQAFSKRCARLGISIEFHKHENGKINGISYHYKGQKFKASELGKPYQYAQLSQRLETAYSNQVQSPGIQESSSTPSFKFHAPSTKSYDSEEEEEEEENKKKKRGQSR